MSNVKNMKFDAMMSQIKDGEMEVDTWNVVQPFYGVATIRMANGSKRVVRVNDLPQSFVDQYNGK